LVPGSAESFELLRESAVQQRAELVELGGIIWGSNLHRSEPAPQTRARTLVGVHSKAARAQWVADQESATS